MRILLAVLVMTMAGSAGASVVVVDSVDEGMARLDTGEVVSVDSLPLCARHEGAVLFDGACAPVLEEAMRASMRVRSSDSCSDGSCGSDLDCETLCGGEVVL